MSVHISLLIGSIKLFVTQALNISYYGVVCKLREAAYLEKKTLSKNIDVNDYLHIDCPYDPRAKSGSPSVIRVSQITMVDQRPVRACRGSTSTMPSLVGAGVDRMEEIEDPDSAYNDTNPESELVKETQQDFNITAGFDQYGSQLEPEGDESPEHQSWNDDNDAMNSPDTRRVKPAVPLPPEDLEIPDPTPDLNEVRMGKVDSLVPVSEDLNPGVEVQASAGLFPGLITLSDSESDGDEDDGSTDSEREDPSDLPLENCPTSASPVHDSVAVEVRVENCEASELYNAAGKAPAVGVVVPKGEGEWWTLREQRKKKKAVEKLAVQQKLERLQEELEAYKRLQAQGVLVGSLSAAPASSDVVLGSTDEPPMEKEDVLLPGTEVTNPVEGESESLVPALSLDVAGVPPVAEEVVPDVVTSLESGDDSLKFSFEHDLETHPMSHEQEALTPLDGDRPIITKQVPTEDFVAPPIVSTEDDVYDIEIGIPS